MAFTAVELIEAKRDGRELGADAIEWFLTAYTDGGVPDYQMAAMAMAIFLKGMTAAELSAWTTAMLHSGEVLDLASIAAAKVDKHSTGGVGDKVTICLAPLVAACGVPVPMLAGRALGHTGGTLDKLQAIRGYRVDLSPATFRRVLDRVGFVIAGQTRRLVPADRVFYALRDATATVESARGTLRYTVQSNGVKLTSVRIDAPRQFDRLLSRTLLAGMAVDDAALILASTAPCIACAEQ